MTVFPALKYAIKKIILKRKAWFILVFYLLMGVVITACQTTGQPSPTPLPPIIETVVVTQEIPGETVLVLITPTPQPVEPTPAPAIPDTLVICMAQEPLSLYPYRGSADLPANTILEAIYDGPMDMLSFNYQPVILEKIPLLADGDAVLQEVEVRPGDQLIDASGELATLETGVSVYPLGCEAEDCILTYVNGDALKMDQMVVTFKLLPGLQWADGFPLTIHDSVYAFALAADPATPIDKFVINRTASYEALDDLTVQWIGIPGFKDPAYATHFWSPLPEHLWGEFSAAELLAKDESARAPLGWGPYTIEEWLPGDKITLRKNEFYFRAHEGLPSFERLVFRFVGEEPNSNIARVLSEECHILDPSIRLGDQTTLLLELHEKGLLKAHFQTTSVWEHLDFGITPAAYEDGWNPFTDRPNLFGDMRTRQAIAMCMDRQRVVDSLFGGNSFVLDTYLPPYHPLFNNDVPHYSFDVNAAALLLDEAGWEDTDEDGVREYTGTDLLIPPQTPLTFTYLVIDSTPQRQQIAEILAASMAECGIQVTLEPISLAEFNTRTAESRVFGRQFDLVGWATRLDHTCRAYLSEEIPGPENNWSGLNISGYQNAEFETACQLALAYLPGQSTINEYQLQAQSIFADELPVIPLFLYIKIAVTSPNICNFVLEPAGQDLWNIENLTYGICENE